MKGYKSFGKGLICQGKQYAENTVFEEDEVVVCQKGMHFCAEPMDVLDFYPPESEFAEVEALDEAKTVTPHEYVSGKLKIGAKISLKELINAQADIDFAKAKGEGSGNYAQGDWGHAVAQGNCGHAAAQGDGGHAAAQGDWGCAAVGGKDAIAAAFGVEGKAKARLGSWIMLAEWEHANDGWHIVTVKTAQIDGEKLKADTWYMLQDGEFVEAED